MKKFLSIFAMAIVAFAAMANETLTIYDAVGSSNYVPFRNIDFQSTGMHSQLIYPAEQLAAMNGQQINSVTFYLTDGLMADGGQLVVKMGETQTATYASAADFRTDLVQVAAMALTPSVTEFVVEFSAPYLYQGGNLVIDFTNPEAGGDNWYGWNSWNGETTGSGNYTAIGSNGAMATFLPKATFDYGVPQEWDARLSTMELNFNIPAEREEVQTITILNKGLNAFTPVISEVNAPFSIDVQPVELAMGESLEIPVKFAPTEPCNCVANLTINCGEAGTFEVVISGIATEPIYEVTAGSKAGNDEFLPFRTYYIDEAGTYGQMIYTEQMLGEAKGNKITKVTFYPTANMSSSVAGGKVELSFKPVEQSEFADATEITEMTAVANYTFEGGEPVLTFVLDEPYQYDGGNLALDVRVVETAHFVKTYFYGESYDYSPSMYHYGSTTTKSNFLPMATFTYDKVQGPVEQWELGDVNHDTKIDVDDVAIIIKVVLGQDVPVYYATEANIDSDAEGKVDVTDVSLLINKILGK